MSDQEMPSEEALAIANAQVAAETQTENGKAAAPVPALKVEHVSHRFKNHQALNDVSFTIDAGAIHGFVGPNGAGKTTMLKIIATLLEPQKGKVEVYGKDVLKHQLDVRQILGYMPDHFSMYRQMTVFEYLDFFGAAYGLPQSRRDVIVNDVLTLTDMTGRRDDLIRGLSRGMQQRVSLARVLINDPKLLLLDEPASGLDPRARIELMEILKELQRLGKTVFVSSHILSELATLCDSVTIIDRGTIRYCGAMRNLLSHENQAQLIYRMELTDPIDGLVETLSALDGVESATCEQNTAAYVVLFDAASLSPTQLLKHVIDAGAQVRSFAPDQRQLNQVFMEMTMPGVGE